MAKTHRSPDGMFAGEGATKQEGPLPLYVCNACHGYVVWATSRKTGRKYLANVQRGYLDQRYYVKRSVHTVENCERRQKGARELEAYFNAKESK